MNELIAIYGLGTETEKNIDRLAKQYTIVGLLDSYKTSGRAFGYSVIGIDDAIKAGVERIIIIARPGSCRAIAGQIGLLCRENGIELTDIKGDNLLKERETVFSFDVTHGYYRDDLLNLIDNHDVISFDLFDTLVTRQVLNQTDLLKILKQRIYERGVGIDDFVRLRMKAETELSREMAPKLLDIYTCVLEGSKDINIKELCALEYELDKAYLIPRKDMIWVLNYASSKGKEIYITTDTYYSAEEIQGIIKQAGITVPVTILTSCENNTGKSEQLFDVLRESCASDRILHIGDSLKADINSAIEHGISAFHILSVEELYEMSGRLGLDEYIVNPCDRITAGMIASRLFNSPFVFEETGRISISDLEDLGYILFAPVITDYVQFVGDYVHTNDINNILFSARDGYLLQKMYELFWPAEHTEYFMTSRVAAVRSCIDSIDDLQLIENTRFTGPIEQHLYVRYGINASEYTDKFVKQSDDIMDYAPLIINNAEKKKLNYLAYINRYCECNDGKTVFVDMAAKGTIQYLIEKIFTQKLKGLYFLQLEPEFATAHNIEVESLYTDDGKTGSKIFEDFYILEPVISAPHPSVIDFTSDGEPVYDKEERSDEEVDAMEHIQDGILRFARDYVRICPDDYRTINTELSARFMGLIHKIQINSDAFKNIRNIDPFVNRITDVRVEV